ncbi:MAG TPA: hypothetical protein VFW40_13525 [Capsulimonadaceae bacterium]|nr:hypothetical protein [Capsulimonadaceae bacterium]
MSPSRKIALALFLFVIAAAAPAWAKQKPLLVPGHRSASVAGMDDASEFFSWLSDHTLLADRYDASRNRALVRIDLADKTVERLGGLTQAFKPMDANPLADPRWQASPNGKWVLFYGFYRNGAALEQTSSDAPAPIPVFAVSIDGRQQIAFTPEEGDSVVAWMPDSQRWVEITATEAIFHSLDDPQSATHVPLSLPAGDGPSAFAPAGSALLRVTSNGHAILAAGLGDPRAGKITLCDLDLAANPAKGRVFSIPIPPVSQINAIAVSPDGKRIAWEWDVSGGGSDDPAWWRERPSPVRYSSDPDNLIELWTSDLDGSHFHMIGRADTGSKTLLWSPDGKTIYFTFGDYFWGFAAK